jgi:hypothetical protein
MRETGTGQQVAQLHDSYMMIILVVEGLKTVPEDEPQPSNVTSYLNYKLCQQV